MKETNNDNQATTAIEPGKTIHVEAPSRKEAGEQIAGIRKQANEHGLVEGPGGFIHWEERENGEKVFVADLIFNEKK